MNAERIARQIVLLAVALVVGAVVAHAFAPGEFPDAGSPNFHAEKQRFYNRLLLAQVMVFPAAITTYYLLRKLWRPQRRGDSGAPDNTPM